MAESLTTLFNNIINRAVFLSKSTYTTDMNRFYLGQHSSALCQALCEELERVYKRIEKLERK
jgi:hypothetical protein